MSVQLTTPQQGCAGTSTRELPTTHWTSFGPVGWPGQEHRRIDEVVTGPSGVHVVLHRVGHSSRTVADDLGLLAPLAAEADAAADAVGAAGPAVRRAGDRGGVPVRDPRRGRGRRGSAGRLPVGAAGTPGGTGRGGFSTSEVSSLVSARLDGSLQQVPVTPGARAGRWPPGCAGG